MRVAAIDIGTNTVRMLVADIGGGRIADVDRAVDVVGLGRGLDRAGALAADSMSAAVSALARYGHRLREAKSEKIRVVATSATRDASNSDLFMERVEEVVGVAPEVIGGDEEASLAFAGAVWGSVSTGRHLVIDPGGGSTEFVIGTDRSESSVSIDIGSVRLTDRLLGARPPMADELERATRHVRELFADVPIPEPPVTVIGVAGTFTSLAAISLGLEEYDRDRVHGTVLKTADLDALVAQLAVLTVSETEAIPSLDPKRAPVILAGAVVASAAVGRTAAGSVVVSETDLLEGVVLGLADRS